MTNKIYGTIKMWVQNQWKADMFHNEWVRKMIQKEVLAHKKEIKIKLTRPNDDF